VPGRVVEFCNGFEEKVTVIFRYSINLINVIIEFAQFLIGTFLGSRTHPGRKEFL
jgi:hypothetical protein